MVLALPSAPNFFLYGEPPHSAAEGFLHLEALEVRSRPSHWTIRPHRHCDLNHLFLITRGAGAMQLLDEVVAFRAPCLLLVPAGAIHGFTYRCDSAGYVLSAASSLLIQATARSDLAFQTLFDRPRVLACEEGGGCLQEVFARLGQELAWRAPGHLAAVDACVLQVLVAVLRLRGAAEAATVNAPASDSRLVARFRERVEQRFRHHDPLQVYAQELGVSLSRLRQACRRCTGFAPSAIIQQRLMGEARRALLYSDLPIADVAFGLGFEDPAYFSRFFGRHAGGSPRTFRGARQAVAPGPVEGRSDERRGYLPNSTVDARRMTKAPNPAREALNQAASDDAYARGKPAPGGQTWT